MIGHSLKRSGGYDPNKPRKTKTATAVVPHKPKWDRVFKLLHETGENIELGHHDLSKQSARDARSLALMYIHGTPRLETSMGHSVAQIIENQILSIIGDSDDAKNLGRIEGAIACIKRLVAREAAQRAVARYQGRLRKTKRHNRSWNEVDAAARQAIRDVRAELGAGAF